MGFRLEVDGGETLPAGKIVGIGKNYADHVREMAGTLWRSGATVDDEPQEDPVVFLKPATSLVGDGGAIVLPPGAGSVHHEVELAVVLGDTLKDVRAEDAMAAVLGYGVALDMTARDLQAAAKKAGRPWALAKGFDTFCPLSRIVPADRVPDPHALDLRLEVNGEVRQHGNTGQMMRPIPRLLEYVSRHMTLEPGDVVLTGTPSGVGPVRAGDRMRAVLEGVAELHVRVEDAHSRE